MIIILSIALMITVTYSVIATMQLLRNNDQFDEISEQLSESLDVLDDVYYSLSEKSQMELFSDEPVVRELISDIKSARDSILLVANKMASIDADGEENE